jgi:3-oxoacyl-[acyl-carrier-protein] synthase II
VAGRERVAITGVGIVSSLGIGREETFRRLSAGERGIGAVSLFDTAGLRSRIAGEVRGLDVAAIAPQDEAHDWSRSDALALLAAREALSQSGHREGAPLGLALGGTTGGMYETERALRSIPAGKIEPQDARRLLDFPLAMSVERVARALGSVLRSATVCSACSSGAVAIALGASWLLSGRASRVVAGGVDGLCQLTFTGFNSLGAMDPEPCRPFDVARAGLNLGEGAACLVLELESSARARGAQVIAYLSGWALASEAHHVTHPEPSGERAARVMLDALEVAALEPRAIDYVNAHGTGTAQNDAMEALALAHVFGADLASVWVSSSKAQVGHTLGAAGAIEAALTALALERGALLPSVGLENAEAPELRLVHAAGQKQALSHALSNSFGFGGACAVLAFDAPNVAARFARELRRESIVISGSASAAAATDPISLLDADRSRRFGRASALVVATAERALESSAREAAGTGLVVGSAFGDVERSVRFLQKLFAHGPKFASPAEFPQLVASTGSGNASIYLGLTGPCLSVSEFGTSGESAVSVALSLLELGLAPAVLAGAAEAHDGIVDAVLGGRRGEGGGFVLLESARAAEERGHTPLAVVRSHRAVRGDPERAFAELGAPSARACVVTPRLPAPVAGALARSSWRDVPVQNLFPNIGYHEALGAHALVVAVARLAAAEVDEALVVSADLDTVYLTELAREGATT